MLVSLWLFSIVLLAITGLLVGSISTGATAEASSIASNLARQRLEEASTVVAQSGMPVVASATSTVSPGGRPYTVTTTFADLGNNIVDIRVTASYQVSYGSSCAANAAGDESCTGNVRTYERALQTRVRRP
ncbi:MAG: type IV pilus modification PilV family protein [bacterium]